MPLLPILWIWPTLLTQTAYFPPLQVRPHCFPWGSFPSSPEHLGCSPIWALNSSHIYRLAFIGYQSHSHLPPAYTPSCQTWHSGSSMIWPPPPSTTSPSCSQFLKRTLHSTVRSAWCRTSCLDHSPTPLIPVTSCKISVFWGLPGSPCPQTSGWGAPLWSLVSHRAYVIEDLPTGLPPPANSICPCVPRAQWSTLKPAPAARKYSSLTSPLETWWGPVRACEGKIPPAQPV